MTRGTRLSNNVMLNALFVFVLGEEEEEVTVPELVLSTAFTGVPESLLVWTESEVCVVDPIWIGSINVKRGVSVTPLVVLV